MGMALLIFIFETRGQLSGFIQRVLPAVNLPFLYGNATYPDSTNRRHAIDLNALKRKLRTNFEYKVSYLLNFVFEGMINFELGDLEGCYGLYRNWVTKKIPTVINHHMIDRVQVDLDNIPLGSIPRFARKHFWHNLETDVKGFDDPDADNDSDEDDVDGGFVGIGAEAETDAEMTAQTNQLEGPLGQMILGSSRHRQDPAPSSSRRQNPTPSSRRQDPAPSSSRQDGAPVRIASRAEAGQGTAADNRMNDGFGEVKVEDGESDGLSDVEDLGDDIYQDVKDEAKDEVEDEPRLNLCIYADTESEDSDVVFLSSKKVSLSRGDGVYSKSPSKRARNRGIGGGGSRGNDSEQVNANMSGGLGAWKRISWGCETW
ncbi:hypothetical protein DL95DRAFT_477119 [Leptodontidium sp. 2 PMI_412]|nr:hypothetical protein DL95DRAFT_477119 [Leptodontidium sp. 2 PMI_412]